VIVRLLFLIYGLLAYIAFFATILYAIGFVGNFVVPKSIDSGTQGSIGTALLVNIVLLGLFGIQHSVMARPGFKSWWMNIVPNPIERSTFVLLSSLLLDLLFWQWRPVTTVVWQIDHPLIRLVLAELSLSGWLMVFYSSFLIDHFDLFGLRQVVLHWRGRPYTHPVFMVRSLYTWVRHPLMAGFLLAFWSTPVMTTGHLLFAVVTTLYILVAIQLEERDLARFLGESYQQYRKETPMLVPGVGNRK